KLLSGIVVATGLYSFNFRIMRANANLYLSAAQNPSAYLNGLNAGISKWLFGEENYGALYPLTNLLLGLFLILVIFALYRYLVSAGGTLLRFSREDSRGLVAAAGFDAKRATIHGLGMANALAALAGVLAVFNDGNASISMGFGVILTALAALVIGERLVGLFHQDKTDIWPMLLAPFIGTLCYQLILKSIRTFNVFLQSIWGYPNPHDPLQFFNSDIRILSALIIVLLYYRQAGQTSRSNPFDRL
uniref:ABC transporter permease subunit n=1 Tax=Methyloglobulus sp. TaxID=2518622 RepID=UPI003988A3AD